VEHLLKNNSANVSLFNDFVNEKVIEVVNQVKLWMEGII